MISRYLTQIALLLLIIVTTSSCLDPTLDPALDLEPVNRERYVQMPQEAEIEIPEHHFDEQDSNLRKAVSALCYTVGSFLGLHFIEYASQAIFEKFK